MYIRFLFIYKYQIHTHNGFVGLSNFLKDKKICHLLVLKTSSSFWEVMWRRERLVHSFSKQSFTEHQPATRYHQTHFLSQSKNLLSKMIPCNPILLYLGYFPPFQVYPILQRTTQLSYKCLLFFLSPTHFALVPLLPCFLLNLS